eukprot:13840299-Heterocapsa_arctica.AAC.1
MKGKVTCLANSLSKSNMRFCTAIAQCAPCKLNATYPKTMRGVPMYMWNWNCGSLRSACGACLLATSTELVEGTKWDAAA